MMGVGARHGRRETAAVQWMVPYLGRCTIPYFAHQQQRRDRLPSTSIDIDLVIDVSSTIVDQLVVDDIYSLKNCFTNR